MTGKVTQRAHGRIAVLFPGDSVVLDPQSLAGGQNTTQPNVVCDRSEVNSTWSDIKMQTTKVRSCLLLEDQHALRLPGSLWQAGVNVEPGCLIPPAVPRQLRTSRRWTSSSLHTRMPVPRGPSCMTDSLALHRRQHLLGEVTSLQDARRLLPGRGPGQPAWPAQLSVAAALSKWRREITGER